MQEIRFNQPTPQREPEKEIQPEERKKNKTSGVFSFVSTLLKVVLVLALLYGAIMGSRYVMRWYEAPKNPNYSAVFLTNGQVYFGKIIKNNDLEIVLNDVYYLQVNDGTNAEALSQAHFSLIKLGSELHGPEDVLYVNRDQVVFYEYLRSDSKLVESIKGTK